MSGSPEGIQNAYQAYTYRAAITLDINVVFRQARVLLFEVVHTSGRFRILSALGTYTDGRNVLYLSFRSSMVYD
jgi:hypothetical protein